jgi:hypothetical protein
LPLDKYTGTYDHELYGEARLGKAGEKLTLSFGAGVEGELEHWETNVFRIRWSAPMFPDMLVTFEPAAAGVEVEKLLLGNVGEWKRIRQ